MRTRFAVTVVSAVALLAACAPVSKKEKEELARPIDCKTAEGDLRVLKSEKDSVAKRIAEGVAGIAPAGIVVGVVSRTEGDKLKVATGEYNRMIDKKVAAIKKKCGLAS